MEKQELVDCPYCQDGKLLISEEDCQFCEGKGELTKKQLLDYSALEARSSNVGFWFCSGLGLIMFLFLSWLIWALLT